MNPENSVQCYRCQAHGHSSISCNKNAVYIKCAGTHNIKEYTKSPDVLPTCANCKVTTQPTTLNALPFCHISQKKTPLKHTNTQILISFPPRNSRSFPEQTKHPNIHGYTQTPQRQRSFWIKSIPKNHGHTYKLHTQSILASN